MLTGSVPTSVTFVANSATAQLSVATEDDAVDEADGTVTVTVDADTADPPTYLTGTPATASVTVTDDEANEFTIGFPRALYTVDEDAGSVTLEIEFVSASGRPPAGPVSVTVETVGEYRAERRDGRARISWLCARHSQSSRAISIQNGRATHEAEHRRFSTIRISKGQEVFNVVLSSPAATHGSDSASLATRFFTVVSITDNDLPAVTVAADAPSVVEGDAGGVHPDADGDYDGAADGRRHGVAGRRRAVRQPRPPASPSTPARVDGAAQGGDRRRWGGRGRRHGDGHDRRRQHRSGDLPGRNAGHRLGDGDRRRPRTNSRSGSPRGSTRWTRTWDR